jgi:hypothetical protein
MLSVEHVFSMKSRPPLRQLVLRLRRRAHERGQPRQEALQMARDLRRRRMGAHDRRDARVIACPPSFSVNVVQFCHATAPTLAIARRRVTVECAMGPCSLKTTDPTCCSVAPVGATFFPSEVTVSLEHNMARYDMSFLAVSFSSWRSNE